MDDQSVVCGVCHARIEAAIQKHIASFSIPAMRSCDHCGGAFDNHVIEGRHMEHLAPAQLSPEMLGVLETARDVGKWVMICNDPPPMKLLGRMWEAKQIADRLLAD